MFRLCWAALNLVWQLLRQIAQLPRLAATALGAATGDQPARPQRMLIALLAILPICFAASLTLSHLTLVMSPSIDAWIVRPAPGPIRKGDLVQFTLSHPAIGAKPVSATKYALCMPGDRLSIIEGPPHSIVLPSEGHFYCNGMLLGVSVRLGPKGLPLERSRWQGIIPAGHVYVGSRHARGFDSRYIGLVPIAGLRRMRRVI
ncbi:S26 family signal peptidase [Sphingomonas sp. MG17]|uniref:S26 family signal peptidase n=1 Tax=Sphingomonas tagetis TaxID=2949092 RepID=A0A9X2HHK0_9SPHN|nr:S26 family signal peptidase [Sphingomonas tagetis]MCP3731341.1 S26 family signal peptidase [Sphingomonas tagetis]